MTDAAKFRTVPFGPKRANKNESTDPRVSGAADGDSCLPAVGHEPAGRTMPPLSCRNETALPEAAVPPGHRRPPTSVGVLRRAQRERNEV